MYLRRKNVLLLSIAYPEVCDSQIDCKCTNPTPSVPASDGDASKLEHKYVHDVYDEIACHFSDTRHTPWPKVVEFLKTLPDGALVADVGCGNGKYLGVNKDLFMVNIYFLIFNKCGYITI